MINQTQIDTLLGELQQKAEQAIRQNETAKAVILLIYQDNIRKWVTDGQLGPPPVSSEDLAQYGVVAPIGWAGGQTRLLQTDKLRDFPNLSAAAFQHPFDTQAVENLQAIPLLATILSKLSGAVWERQMWLHQVSTSVRLGPNQGHSLYNKFVKAAEILDLETLPEIYVSNRYQINAYAYGIEKYTVTLFSGLIDTLTDDELMAVIGHELGHIKCDHMLYKTIAMLLRILGIPVLSRLLPAGTGWMATLSLQVALLNWERMAEFSCDRAALLVVQDPDIVASALAKLAGGSRRMLNELNLDEILKQADDYHETEEGYLEQLLKMQLMIQQTHPFPVVRVKEITKWAKSEQYQEIMAGNYLRQVEKPGFNKSGTYQAEEELRCAKCGIMVFDSWKRCPRCGSDLGTE